MPTEAFSLNDEGIQVALAPLAPALELCLNAPSQYVLLGPGFTSERSIGVVSPRFRDWIAVVDALETARKQSTPLTLGVLKHTLTTTRMLLFHLSRTAQERTRQGWDALSGAVRTLELHPLRGHESSEDYLRALKSVDVALVVRGGVEAARANGMNVLTDNLEGEVASLLGHRRLPRGVWLGRVSTLSDITRRTVLQEFLDSLNQRINKPGATSAFVAEHANDRPLTTFAESVPEDLFTIKDFAEKCILHDCGEFSWKHFAFEPMIDAQTAVAALSNIMQNISEHERGGIGGGIDQLAPVIASFETACRERLAKQDWWESDVLKFEVHKAIASLNNNSSVSEWLGKIAFEVVDRIPLGLRPNYGSDISTGEYPQR